MQQRSLTHHVCHHPDTGRLLRDRTGQLTARLGQDLMQMLQPLNWALSQLLQNILSLGGGLFMCQSTRPAHCSRPPPRLSL